MFAALGPRGCAPLGTPAGGAPLHRTPYKRLRRPCRGPLAEGQGCRGKSAPDTLPAGLGRSGRVKGPCPRPCGAAGRTNPLTRPPLEKRATGPHRGLEGHCRSGWGSRLAQRPRSGLALTPRNDPNAPGWWLGVLFPQPPATWRTPPEGRRRRSCSALLLPPRRGATRVSEGNSFVAPSLFRSGFEHCKRSLRKCALASLRGLVRRHPVGASRGFTR